MSRDTYWDRRLTTTSILFRGVGWGEAAGELRSRATIAFEQRRDDTALMLRNMADEFAQIEAIRRVEADRHATEYPPEDAPDSECDEEESARRLTALCRALDLESGSSWCDVMEEVARLKGKEGRP